MLAKNVLYIYAGFCCSFPFNNFGEGGEISGGKSLDIPYSQTKKLKNNYQKYHYCMTCV